MGVRLRRFAYQRPAFKTTRAVCAVTGRDKVPHQLAQLGHAARVLHLWYRARLRRNYLCLPCVRLCLPRTSSCRQDIQQQHLQAEARHRPLARGQRSSMQHSDRRFLCATATRSPRAHPKSANVHTTSHRHAHAHTCMKPPQHLSPPIPPETHAIDACIRVRVCVSACLIT